MIDKRKIRETVANDWKKVVEVAVKPLSMLK